MKLQVIEESYTIEHVLDSDYWGLIAILIWEHYSEKNRQDPNKITVTEKWYGKASWGSSHNSNWQDPNHTEKDYTRTLSGIIITFKGSDYTAHIKLSVSGNVATNAYYNSKNEDAKPFFYGPERNLDITNWLINNNFIKIC